MTSRARTNRPHRGRSPRPCRRVRAPRRRSGHPRRLPPVRFGGWRRLPLPVVVRWRERVSLSLDLEFVLVVLAADLGPLLLVLLGLGDILPRWRVGRRRHLVRVGVVDLGCHPFLLGQPGKPASYTHVTPRRATPPPCPVVGQTGWTAARGDERRYGGGSGSGSDGGAK